MHHVTVLYSDPYRKMHIVMTMTITANFDDSSADNVMTAKSYTYLHTYCRQLLTILIQPYSFRRRHIAHMYNMHSTESKQGGQITGSIRSIKSSETSKSTAKCYISLSWVTSYYKLVTRRIDWRLCRKANPNRCPPKGPLSRRQPYKIGAASVTDWIICPTLGCSELWERKTVRRISLRCYAAIVADLPSIPRHQAGDEAQALGAETINMDKLAAVVK